MRTDSTFGTPEATQVPSYSFFLEMYGMIRVNLTGYSIYFMQTRMHIISS